MFWHDKESSVKTFWYLDTRCYFLLKRSSITLLAGFHIWFIWQSFCYLTGTKYLTGSIQTIFKLSCLELPFCLGVLFVCVFLWYLVGCFFFFFGWGGGHFFKNSGIPEWMSDRLEALYMFWLFTNSVEILRPAWGQVVNRIISSTFYVGTYMSSLQCCLL